MAIYHLHAKVISRASGRSAVAAAAYRSASELPDERLARPHDFTNKAGVVHSEILLPDWRTGAIAGPRQRCGTRSSGPRSGRMRSWPVRWSFPFRGSCRKDEGIRLAQDFVREQFVERGMVADLNVHWQVDPDGEAKPHAHVMLATRAVGPDGFGLRRRGTGTGRSCWRTGGSAGRRWRMSGWRSLGMICGSITARTRRRGLRWSRRTRLGRLARGARIAARKRSGRRSMRRLPGGTGSGSSPSRSGCWMRMTRQQSTFTRQDLARMLDRHTADAAQFADGVGEGGGVASAGAGRGGWAGPGAVLDAGDAGRWSSGWRRRRIDLAGTVGAWRWCAGRQARALETAAERAAGRRAAGGV